MSNTAVRQARGIIFDKETLEIVNYPFEKFNTVNEDFKFPKHISDYTILEKTDGSMMSLWFDSKNFKWRVSSSGQVNATHNFNEYDEVNSIEGNPIFIDLGENLETLFWEYFSTNNIDLDSFTRGFTYVFELTSNFNEVVNTYDSEPNLKLIMVRNLQTLNEESIFTNSIIIGIPTPKTYNFSSFEEVFTSLKTVKQGDINFEGYILLDEEYNRFKIKSNKYLVFAHFNGEEMSSSSWRLLDIVLNKEIEEVSIIFPNLEKPLKEIESKLIILENMLIDTFLEIKLNDNLEKKDQFIKAQKALNFNKKLKFFMGIFTNMFKNEDLTINECMKLLDKKKFYKSLMSI